MLKGKIHNRWKTGNPVPDIILGAIGIKIIIKVYSFLKMAFFELSFWYWSSLNYDGHGK
jgi:hypothetical protein